jgi:hypothetical protein
MILVVMNAAILFTVFKRETPQNKRFLIQSWPPLLKVSMIITTGENT